MRVKVLLMVFTVGLMGAYAVSGEPTANTDTVERFGFLEWAEQGGVFRMRGPDGFSGGKLNFPARSGVSFYFPGEKASNDPGGFMRMRLGAPILVKFRNPGENERWTEVRTFDWRAIPLTDP